MPGLWTLGVYAMGATVLILPRQAAGQVVCGEVIRETVTLTADVGPCDGVAAALVVDGGRLDLGGFRVECADMDADGERPEGVVLVGRKARLANGTIAGCECGVVAAGRGRHRVEGVTARDGTDDGFFATEDAGRNRFLGNVATGNADDGFQLDSSKNKLMGNVVEANGEDGIDVLRDANRNKLVGNSITGNLDDGIDVGGGRNKIVGNVVSANGEDGIDIRGRRNVVKRNTSSGHPGGFDVRAGDPCRSNRYRKNVFETRDDDCVR